MTEETLANVLRWVVAAPLLGLGCWIHAFNALRHRQPLGQREGDRRGESSRPGSDPHVPSSIPMAGSLFLFAGLGVAPVGFHPVVLALLLLEIFAVGFSTSRERDGEGEGEGYPGPSEVDDPGDDDRPDRA